MKFLILTIKKNHHHLHNYGLAMDFLNDTGYLLENTPKTAIS